MSLCYWTGNEISSVNQESKIARRSEAGVITWHEGEVMLNMVISVKFKSWTLHVHVPVYNHEKERDEFMFYAYLSDTCEGAAEIGQFGIEDRFAVLMKFIDLMKMFGKYGERLI